MRKFVVGDIRGDIYLLEKLLDKIGPVAGDSVICLGSYLGPGGNSKATLDRCIGLLEAPATFVFLRGCYEFMFQRVTGTAVTLEDGKMWQQMGGAKVFEDYKSDGAIHIAKGSTTELVNIELKIPEAHIRFMESLPQWWEDTDLPVVACHAGSHPGVFGLSSELAVEIETVMTAKGWWTDDKLRLPGRDIVFSHVPFKKPFIGKGKVGIDLGAGAGGKLCAYELYSQSFSIVGRSNG